MTNEEAVELLDSAIEVARDKMAIALLMAKQALEKQIQKKPIFEKDRYGTNHFHCPSCKEVISKEVIIGRLYNFPISHCDCGQALDWSDANARNN